MKRNLKNFTKECVEHYATYSDLDGFYSLHISSIPDFVQHEFAALIMSDDETYAWEATGPNNKYWRDKMLPALTNYLADSTDRDMSIEFNNIWRDSITACLTSQMQELINEALNDFNSHNRYSRTKSFYYGVPSHGPI